MSALKITGMGEEIKSLPGKELFYRLTARAFRKLLSTYVFSYFPFSFEGRIWDLIVSDCISY